MSQEATKHDTGKTPLELLPLVSLLAVGEVLKFGAQKYAPNNWRKGMAYGRLIGAMLRHILDFMLGVKKDHDSGLHPLAHACCDIMFLIEYDATGSGTDDRYKYSPAQIEKIRKFIQGLDESSEE